MAGHNRFGYPNISAPPHVSISSFFRLINEDISIVTNVERCKTLFSGHGTPGGSRSVPFSAYKSNSKCYIKRCFRDMIFTMSHIERFGTPPKNICKMLIIAFISVIRDIISKKV